MSEFMIERCDNLSCDSNSDGYCTSKYDRISCVAQARDILVNDFEGDFPFLLSKSIKYLREHKKSILALKGLIIMDSKNISDGQLDEEKLQNHILSLVDDVIWGDWTEVDE